MTLDPSDLASQISEDLAPTEIPDDLSALSDDAIAKVLFAVALDIVHTKRLVDEAERADATAISDRYKAILKIKRDKLKRMSAEHGRRKQFVAPSNLEYVAYEDLHALNLRLVAEQRRIKGLAKGSHSDAAAASRVLLELQKGLLGRVQKEFTRRKSMSRDVDMFLVRETSADPDLLEEYLNQMRKEHMHWWPHSFVAIGDRMLVIWRTKEAQ